MADPQRSTTTAERAGLRPAAEVMQLERLGALHPGRLSFAHTLIRRMHRERWRIRPRRFALDDQGYGTAIYRIDTPQRQFEFIAFADPLSDAERSDRVIAERWDVTCALCDGELDEGDIERLRQQVPRQEVGRFDPQVLVLSRANRSVRCFQAVADTLAAGRQPDRELLVQAGYLLRTTAVYGNGKFGIADYARLRTLPGLERPFSAQMLVVYLVREFGLDQVEHIARRRNPDGAITLDRELRRFIGVGNATGLGMAPFLITHPQLIDRWVHCREQARAAALEAPVTADDRDALAERIRHMSTALATVRVDDPRQTEKNKIASTTLNGLADWLGRQPSQDGLWRELATRADRADFETGECVTSLLLELVPDTVEQLADRMAVEENPALAPTMMLSALRALIETRYDWALAIDFDDPEQSHLFWYRSEEKEEPRLGVRAEEPGADREMAIDIARQVQRCYRAVHDTLARDGDQPVATFLLRQPDWRGIVRRIQTLGRAAYGEIRANILRRDTLPIHLLRCKLSFLGAFRFDPRSDRWVRITLFQGAPLSDELDDATLAERWYPPAFPETA